MKKLVRKKHLSDESFAVFLDYLISNPSVPHLLLEMMVYTGMRQVELVGLRASNFDMKENKVYIHAAKGSQSRWVDLPEDFIERFTGFYNLLEKSEKTIGQATSNTDRVESHKWNVRNWFRKAMNESLGENHRYSTHSLRHTFAVTYINDESFGGDLIKVQQAMGHKNLNSTGLYLKSAKEEDVRKGALGSVLNKLKKAM